MRFLAIASLIILATGPVAAATAPLDQSSTPPAAHHAKSRAKPVSEAKKTKMPDPDAGVTEEGTPNAAVTNGGELKK